MTPEQQALSDKLTNLQRGVVLGVVAGKSQRQAYYDAGGKAKNDAAADTSAYEIMSRPEVDDFYKSLIAEVAEKAIWTRQDSLKVLSEIAMGHDEMGKTSDRVAAVKELNAMEGYNAASKTEITGSGGGPIKVMTLDDFYGDA